MNRKQYRRQARTVSKAAASSSTASAPTATLFDEAVQHHQMGRPAEAEGLCRRILAADSRHAGALHLLGVTACQAGRNDVAVDLIGEAIDIDEMVAAYHSNRGVALKKLGRLDDALAAYDAAIRIEPDYAEVHLNRSSALTGLGRLDDALAACAAAVRLRPGYAEAHLHRGNILTDLGRLDDALGAYDVAIRIDPDYAEAHSNRGAALKALGRLDDALAAYDAAIRSKPDYAEAHSNRGAALKTLGRLDAALAAYDAAIRSKPDYAEARFNRGNALKDLGRLDDALAAYDAAIRIEPNYAEVHLNRGTTLIGLGRLDDALAAYDTAIRIRPYYAEAHVNRGTAVIGLGRLDDALATCDVAVCIKPDFAEAHVNRGNALKDLGRLDDALAAYGTAIRIKPDFAEAHNSRGVVLTDLGRLDDGLAAYGTAIRIEPNFAEAHYNCGNALKDFGRLDDALGAYAAAIRIRPDYAEASGQLAHCLRHACAWRGFDSRQQELLQRIPRRCENVSPFVVLTLDSTAEQQRAVARRWGEKRCRGITPLGKRTRHEDTKVRLGYLSADFRSHATAYLIAELIERHDRERFDVAGYSYGPDDGSTMRRRLIDGFDRFIDIRWQPPRDAARRIQLDGIDILVDLKGYTRDARTQILAYRPAPIQVNYLGYPGTMGADFIDYIVADSVCIPPGEDLFFSEKVVRLPDSYQPNDSRRPIAEETPRREDCGLPKRGFVFCCFNNTYKITPTIFAVWMRLLSKVPTSVLWLLDTNASVKENLRREAASADVAPDRLVFAPRMPLPEHLARHRRADLFLDTLPCGAHTTASDALWAGLPVLTCLGQTFAGRVAASLLAAVGLPDLITASLADYEALALALAADPARLAALRDGLAANRPTAPLFDIKRFTRNIEEAYIRMWETHCRGRPPAAMTIG
jgi:predicted O-linked N-acetylglucosamine transferase (SPINDLY family)